MSTTVDQSVQIAELQKEVRELRRELAALRARANDTGNGETNAVSRCLKQLVEMTNELIPGNLRVENSEDPEHPQTVCLVFHVSARDKFRDTDAVIDAEIEWHRRAHAIVPEATCYFRLAIE